MAKNEADIDPGWPTKDIFYGIRVRAIERRNVNVCYIPWYGVIQGGRGEGAFAEWLVSLCCLLCSVLLYAAL